MKKAALGWSLPLRDYRYRVGVTHQTDPQLPAQRSTLSGTTAFSSIPPASCAPDSAACLQFCWGEGRCPYEVRQTSREAASPSRAHPQGKVGIFSCFSRFFLPCARSHDCHTDDRSHFPQPCSSGMHNLQPSGDASPPFRSSDNASLPTTTGSPASPLTRLHTAHCTFLLDCVCVLRRLERRTNSAASFSCAFYICLLPLPCTARAQKPPRTARGASSSLTRPHSAEVGSAPCGDGGKEGNSLFVLR